ncbi:MAG: adenylate/guanylate cyclase domain-containing protein [Coleofasciculaceae cyanobacterium]
MNSNPKERQETILIVDDLPDNLRLLFTLLMPQGYQVGKALNGQMALKSATSNPPDLILLDINMPNMDGYQVCQQLKANVKTKEIPVIFISALDEVWDKVKAFKVGGIDYITKPFQAEEVLARVENQIKIQALQKALRKEQEKSTEILLNILPEAIVQELKYTDSSTPTQFEEATFLFADIAQFTPNSSLMPPVEVVALLNQVFTAFDQLVSKYSVEKIRTIGDSYFVSAGIPVIRPDHAQAIANLALDMQATISQFHWPNGNQLQLRIGINTGGPVVAAVIGTKKFAYDIWGDAVNIASRMESTGQPGKIQLTLLTATQLKHQYKLTHRGTIPIKGKSEMTTYWLESALPN